MRRGQGRGVSRSADPYSEQQYDEAFAATLRSDPVYIALRVITLAMVFWFMGRAIVLHDLGAGFLLLPIAFELLTIFWIGLFLSWFLVDCPSFAKNARKPGLALFWTLATAVVISFVLGIEDDALRWDQVMPGWVDGWRSVVETGLVWAFLAQLLMLVSSSVFEVLRWRRRGGAFMWTSVLDSGLRFAALLLALFAGVFLFAMLAGVLEFLLGDYSAAWVVFVFLLAVEVGALTIGVIIHRKVLSESADQSMP